MIIGVLTNFWSKYRVSCDNLDNFYFLGWFSINALEIRTNLLDEKAMATGTNAPQQSLLKVFSEECGFKLS